ncbi:MAG: hypothetical protein MJY87_02400 [Fibrobacter sp.]|nr:hypothetical protein [Fibrobacter sp.]
MAGMKGASTGAIIGSMIAPGIGTGIGAGAGWLLDRIGGGSSRNAAHSANIDAREILDESKDYIEQAATANKDLADVGYELAGSLWDPDGTLTQKYQDALSGVDSLQGYSPESLFEYDKSIEDFYDPAFQLSVNMANDAIGQSQATGGNMFSSDTANKIAAKNNVLATQMYKEARDAMNQDKALDQSIWAGNESARQAAASSAAQVADAKLSAYGTGMSNLSDAQQDYIRSLQDINSGYASDMTDYLGTKAGVKAQDPGKNQWWDIFDLF